jgi:hypothetical protein
MWRPSERRGGSIHRRTRRPPGSTAGRIVSGNTDGPVDDAAARPHDRPTRACPPVPFAENPSSFIRTSSRTVASCTRIARIDRLTFDRGSIVRSSPVRRRSHAHENRRPSPTCAGSDETRALGLCGPLRAQARHVRAGASRAGDEATKPRPSATPYASARLSSRRARPAARVGWFA